MPDDVCRREGHVLSCTRSGYGRLSVRAVRGGLEVSFTVTNTGDQRGAEVPQVYVGPAPHAPVDMPVRTLAAFERVELCSRQSRRLTLRVDERRLPYGDTGKGRWALPAGRRKVEVGSSSRDIRLTGTGTPPSTPSAPWRPCPAVRRPGRRAGRELDSASAAVADYRRTLLCTYLSAALLAGLVLNAALGWSRAEPVAALVIAALAAKEGLDAWQGKGCCAPSARDGAGVR
ncbi:fibronectin type III-like domain-contianing protein [Streptomyces sp. HMX87]|uniref:fibronectin type III-like domain-contianing protein n=1 Tax=Streptomyces sp. HMX87 TaxID=3390849 RepID=UPI003A8A7061